MSGLHVVMPVTLSFGKWSDEIGTVKVPLVTDLASGPISPTKGSCTVTVTARADAAGFGRNLAELLRAAAAEYERLGDARGKEQE